MRYPRSGEAPFMWLPSCDCRERTRSLGTVTRRRGVVASSGFPRLCVGSREVGAQSLERHHVMPDCCDRVRDAGTPGPFAPPPTLSTVESRQLVALDVARVSWATLRAAPRMSRRPIQTAAGLSTCSPLCPCSPAGERGQSSLQRHRAAAEPFPARWLASLASVSDSSLPRFGHDASARPCAGVPRPRSRSERVAPGGQCRYAKS
jgi:hypothetical protein